MLCKHRLVCIHFALLQCQPQGRVEVADPQWLHSLADGREVICHPVGRLQGSQAFLNVGWDNKLFVPAAISWTIPQLSNGTIARPPLSLLYFIHYFVLIF